MSQACLKYTLAGSIQHLRDCGSNELCPCLSNTFRVKRSPKKSPLSDLSPVGACFLSQPSLLLLDDLTLAVADFTSLQDSALVDETGSHSQDDHATDEEKLASSTGHKWAALQDMDKELDSDQQDFPQPCDLTSFVNENILPPQAPGEAPPWQLFLRRNSNPEPKECVHWA